MSPATSSRPRTVWMASGSVLPFTVMRFDLQDRKFFLGFFRGPRFVAAEMHPQLAMIVGRQHQAAKAHASHATAPSPATATSYCLAPFRKIQRMSRNRCLFGLTRVPQTKVISMTSKKIPSFHYREFGLREQGNSVFETGSFSGLSGKFDLGGGRRDIRESNPAFACWPEPQITSLPRFTSASDFPRLPGMRLSTIWLSGFWRRRTVPPVVGVPEARRRVAFFGPTFIAPIPAVNA